ncbi:MAG: tRNA dihydrouridine synthase DusB [Melioribacteraceae bacterium]|nr:tRNA dihydrouridine synthase DusB [Melioribacteraceae bacterium]MCO6474473.1 tRNA dihydrouridine synthase DusB [Melioribacteraceae bacterium]MDD3558093.1 tRNA dihydrouridine synthase DusB [Melioribacteraceae bacterium]
MFKINDIEINKALLLAPMEDITGVPFRRLCKEMGADVVYTEFVNSDGLIRNNKKTADKMKITEFERPVGIQIYGGEIGPMVEAAKISEKLSPDIIDINAGCWVKKIAKRGAGAGLLKDPDYMEKMVKSIVDAVEIPVTVKTRLGWDEENILILEIAKRIEDAGAKALTVHCRTRSQGHSGEADWSWIPRIKEVVDIPVILNGGIFTPEDIKRAFDETNADGVMIARGAIGNPWIFQQAKELLETGSVRTLVTHHERVETILKHLRYELEEKDERRAIIPFRKYYTGYLKGLFNASKIRQQIMQIVTYDELEILLYDYLNELESHDKLILSNNDIENN